MDRAWKISRYFDLPTLYDVAFMAVAEMVAERTAEECEYWTANEKLVNVLARRRKYVNYLQYVDFLPPPESGGIFRGG